MTQLEILDELKKLPPLERREVIEAALQTLGEELAQPRSALNRAERRKRLAASAELMMNDYLNDPELTALTALDGEDFYEYDKHD